MKKIGGEQLFIKTEKKKRMSAPNYSGVAYGKLMPPCINYKCYK